MRRTLFKKTFLATSLIMLLSTISILLVTTIVYSNYASNEKHKSLDKACASVSDFVEKLSDDIAAQKRGAYYVISNLSKVSDFHFLMLDTTNTIVICSCDEWEGSGNCEHTGTVIDDEYTELLLKNDKTTLSTLGIYSQPQYAAAESLVTYKGEPCGTVIATASSYDVKVFMEAVVRLFFFSAIIPMLLAFLAIYVMTYRLTKPLKQMRDAAKAMAVGDFSKRIPVTSDDEIGELAVSFNNMTNSVARLEAMRKDFVANVSHEFKTPMTTIAGFIDGIIDGTIEPDKQGYYLQIVSDEVKRLSGMVQSMLSLSRIDSGELTINRQEFDFKEQLLNILIGQEQRIEQKQLSILGLEEMPYITVNADKDLMHNVIYNLIDNAVKFSNEGGYIKFTAESQHKKLHFRIENSSDGIPQNELPYVFDRFYKGDKSRSINKNSTGLGLYIVKTIVKNHGGTISVSSVLNKFTAFDIILPMN